jgi:hypothetical protein
MLIVYSPVGGFQKEFFALAVETIALSRAL